MKTLEQKGNPTDERLSDLTFLKRYERVDQCIELSAKETDRYVKAMENEKLFRNVDLDNCRQFASFIDVYGSFEKKHGAIATHRQESEQRLVVAEEGVRNFEEGKGLSWKERLLYAVPFVGSYFKEKKMEIFKEELSVAALFYKNDVDLYNGFQERYSNRIRMQYAGREFSWREGDTHVDQSILNAAIPVEKKDSILSFARLVSQADLHGYNDSIATLNNDLGQTLLFEKTATGQVKMYLSDSKDGGRGECLGLAWNDDALKLSQAFASGAALDMSLLNTKHERFIIARSL